MKTIYIKPWSLIVLSRHPHVLGQNLGLCLRWPQHWAGSHWPCKPVSPASLEICIGLCDCPYLSGTSEATSQHWCPHQSIVCCHSLDRWRTPAPTFQLTVAAINTLGASFAQATLKPDIFDAIKLGDVLAKMKEDFLSACLYSLVCWWKQSIVVPVCFSVYVLVCSYVCGGGGCMHIVHGHMETTGQPWVQSAGTIYLALWDRVFCWNLGLVN